MTESRSRRSFSAAGTRYGRRKKNRRRKGKRRNKAGCARRPFGPRAQYPSSERGAVLHQHPAAVLDLLNLRDRAGEGVGLGEFGRRGIKDFQWVMQKAFCNRSALFGRSLLELMMSVHWVG